MLADSGRIQNGEVKRGGDSLAPFARKLERVYCMCYVWNIGITRNVVV